jgi:hypothetical protein
VFLVNFRGSVQEAEQLWDILAKMDILIASNSRTLSRQKVSHVWECSGAEVSGGNDPTLARFEASAAL